MAFGFTFWCFDRWSQCYLDERGGFYKGFLVSFIKALFFWCGQGVYAGPPRYVCWNRGYAGPLNPRMLE